MLDYRHMFPYAQTILFISIWQRAPRALSVAVVTKIIDPFLNSIWASTLFSVTCFISSLKLAEFGINSDVIFFKTSLACFKVFEATHIFVPGYKIHRTTQKTAVKYVLPSIVITHRLFILCSGGFPHFHRLVSPTQFSIYFHLRPKRSGERTLGGIITLLTLILYALQADMILSVLGISS